MATRVVVEWTRASLRVAVAEDSGARFRVRTIRSQSLGASESVTDSLRQVLKAAKLSPSEVIGVISREQVITRVVKFPSIVLGELAPMVEHYAKAQLPYAREHTVTDFHVLSQQGGFSTVAIVACQREVVDRQLAVLRDAGLQTTRLTVSSWGVLGWYRQIARAYSIQEPALIVNVDDARTDLVLITTDRIVSSRSIGQGSQDLTGAADTAELLVLEIERSRNAIRKELPETELRSLVLTGLGEVSAWGELLSQRIGLPVVIAAAAQPFKERLAGLMTPISPVVIGGVAVSELAGLLDLSPPETRRHAYHRRQVKELATLSLLLVGVMALGASLLSLQVSRQRHIAVQLHEALTQVAPTAKQVQEQSRSTQLVNSLLADRRQLALILAGIFRRTSPSITLERLSFERTRRELSLRGTATSTQEVLDYVKVLEHLEGIDGVELKYTARRSTSSGERTDFELLLRQGKLS